ncbi:MULTISPECIES: S1 family peptidase [Streptomyces]|uniref:S1 family peptidase n=1 Tax=Streptomyces TaxID=1883 RepID=UPI00160007C3|nr:trypsin-like serine protease [Streptomyces murinus]MBA9050340.1 secreted trypsin-like serine protease [Streptomyces murinus]
MTNTRRNAALAALAAAGCLLTAAPAHAIIGGSSVTSISDAPWAAQVRFNGGDSHCSGAVIAAQWVLTAGHCKADDDFVLLGSATKGKGTQITTDKQIQPNGEDILLLHLTKPYDTTYAKYGASSDRPSDDKSVTAYGYGDTDNNGGKSTTLKSCTMKVKDNDASDDHNDHVIQLTKGSGISASGDSGGPAFYNGVIVGTDSRGTDTVKDYADITAYHSWIAQTIGA